MNTNNVFHLRFSFEVFILDFHKDKNGLCKSSPFL